MGEIKRIVPRRKRSINSALAVLGVRDHMVYAKKVDGLYYGTIYNRLGGEEEVLRIAKAAHREKIFDMHPDRNPQADKEFHEEYCKEVNEAYQFVQRVIKRRMGGR